MGFGRAAFSSKRSDWMFECCTWWRYDGTGFIRRYVDDPAKAPTERHVGSSVLPTLAQHAGRLTASPPSEVSLYFSDMSWPV